MSATDPESDTDGAVAPKTWKDLSGISYEFNAHVNGAYKHIHDALNDIYSDILDHADLELLFTDATLAAIKTQSSDGVNAVRLLTDIIYDRITVIATPGSTTPDRIREILDKCSLNFVDRDGSRKSIRTVAHLDILLKDTLARRSDYATICLTIHGLHFHPMFTPTNFDGVSTAPFRRSSVLPTDGPTAPAFTPAVPPAATPKVNSVPYSAMHSFNKQILPGDVLLRYETHYSDKSLATHANISTPFESSVPNLLCDPSGNTK